MSDPGRNSADTEQITQGSTPRNEVAAASSFQLGLDQSKYSFVEVKLSRGDTIPCA